MASDGSSCWTGWGRASTAIRRAGKVLGPRDGMLGGLRNVTAPRGTPHAGRRPPRPQADNFAIGYDADERHRLYTFDFGLSSQYLDKDGLHRPLRTGLSLIGTLRYASLRTTKATSRAARRPRVPRLRAMVSRRWDAPVEARRAQRRGRSERNRIIAEAKRALDLHSVPAPFGELIRYARELAYEATPDYATWVTRFEALAGSASGMPDWLLPHPPVTAGRVARSRKQRPTKRS